MEAAIFSLENLFTLAMLILLQAVLGFDNLLYISIESKKVAPERQAFVRKLGIGLAVFYGAMEFYNTCRKEEYFHIARTLQPFEVLAQLFRMPR